MTLDNLKKKYKHLNFLIKGEFTSQDFNKEFGVGEDGGFSHMGKITPDRRELIIVTAKENLKDLLEKYPSLEKTEVKEVEVKKPVKEVNNSKGK